MAETEGPGATHVGCVGICAALAWLILLGVLDLYFLAAIWPHPTPSGQPATETTTNPPTQTLPPASATNPPQTGKGVAVTNVSGPTVICVDCAKFKAGSNQQEECDCWHRVAAMQGLVCKEGQAPPKLASDPGCIHLWSPMGLGFGGWHMMWGEQRLLFIVMLCGFLGSLIYSLRSLFWYTGNRQLVWSWIPMTTLVPIVGSMVAVVFYLVLRGGLFSPTTTVSDTSPFGFAAMSALVGMFINETVLKLKSIFETIMTKKEQGTNTVQPTVRPSLTSFTPQTAAAGQDVNIKVDGAGFTKDSKVYADGKALTTTWISDKQLEALIPKELVPTAKLTLNISVQTAGGGTSSPMTFTTT